MCETLLQGHILSTVADAASIWIYVKIVMELAPRKWWKVIIIKPKFVANNSQKKHFVSVSKNMTGNLLHDDTKSLYHPLCSVNLCSQSKPGWIHKGFHNRNLRGMNIILLTIPTNPSKSFLRLWVSRDADITSDLTTRFSASKNIHQRCFPSSTYTNQSSQDARPECSTHIAQQL